MNLRGAWRQRLGKLIEFVDGEIAEFVITQHHHFYPNGYCQFSTIISSAQIMEELSAFSFLPSEKRYASASELGSLFVVTTSRLAVSSESAKELVRLFFPLLSSRADYSARQGDNISGLSRRLEKNAWIDSVDTYRLASMIDPSNFGARLNCAAMRLRIANDGSQSFQ